MHTLSRTSRKRRALLDSLHLWGRVGVRAGCFAPVFHVNAAENRNNRLSPNAGKARETSPYREASLVV